MGNVEKKDKFSESLEEAEFAYNFTGIYAENSDKEILEIKNKLSQEISELQKTINCLYNKKTALEKGMRREELVFEVYSSLLVISDSVRSDLNQSMEKNAFTEEDILLIIQYSFARWEAFQKEISVLDEIIGG